MPTYMIIKKYYDDLVSAYNDAEPGDIIYQIPEEEGIRVVDPPPESVKLVGEERKFPMKHGTVLISVERVKFEGWFYTGDEDPSLFVLEWAAKRISEEIEKRKLPT